MKPDAWPFVPPSHRRKLGDGPFRVRGTVYSGNVEFAQKRIPGGWPAVCADIGNPLVEAFFRDTIFLAASLYDIEPLMHLLRAITRIERIPLDKYIRDGSRAAGEDDVTGKYRAQLRSTTAEEMSTRLPRIFGRYFDPCRAEPINIGKSSTEMRFTGLPASAIGLYVWANEGFVTAALEAAGAHDVRFAWSAPIAEGDLEGVPVQTLNCRIAWTNLVR